MKRYKISLFDLVLLLLVLLVGGITYWQLHRTTVSQPESAEVLLGDIQRSADRYPLLPEGRHRLLQLPHRGI